MSSNAKDKRLFRQRTNEGNDQDDETNERKILQINKIYNLLITHKSHKKYFQKFPPA